MREACPLKVANKFMERLQNFQTSTSKFQRGKLRRSSDCTPRVSGALPQEIIEPMRLKIQPTWEHANAQPVNQWQQQECVATVQVSRAAPH